MKIIQLVSIFLLAATISACGSPGVGSADEIYGDYVISKVVLATLVDGELEIEEAFEQKQKTHFSFSENSFDLPTQEGDNTVPLKNPTYVVQDDGTVDVQTDKGKFVTKVVKYDGDIYMRVSELNMDDFQGHAFLLLE